jgi:serine phosphatase RsbU (regulator of sigma subunit)
VLKKHANYAPAEVAAAIFDALDEFREGAAISDDQTVVVLKVN